MDKSLQTGFCWKTLDLDFLLPITFILIVKSQIWESLGRLGLVWGAAGSGVLLGDLGTWWGGLQLREALIPLGVQVGGGGGFWASD